MVGAIGLGVSFVFVLAPPGCQTQHTTAFGLPLPSLNALPGPQYPLKVSLPDCCVCVCLCVWERVHICVFDFAA